MEQFVFKIDKRLKEQLKRRAKREGMSISGVLRAFTKAYVNDQLDIGVLSKKYK